MTFKREQKNRNTIIIKIFCYKLLKINKIKEFFLTYFFSIKIVHNNFFRFWIILNKEKKN